MSALADLRRALARAEALLADEGRDRQAHPEDAAATTRAERLGALAEELERQAAACDSLPPALARRLTRVQARLALQGRRVPAEALSGVYEAVRAAAEGDSWARAGMSGVFLDAPRSLARWRTAALAACVLLAVGALEMGRSYVTPRTDGHVRPLQDPRDDYLRRMDAPVAAAAGALPRPGTLAVPVGMPTGAPSGGTASTRDTAPTPGAWHATTQGGHPRGFVLFHMRGGGAVSGGAPIEERTLLDAAGVR
ncbi:MAG: hypothetical protein P1V36_14085, partial [Planctomycetota bacterium]|nr:hypothetical protein [Planctomycetota bacterium]